jgi:hypothetical protein
VEKPDGELAVLEFKTGRRRPEHEAQTALYQQAAAALFPGAESLHNFSTPPTQVFPEP